MYILQLLPMSDVYFRYRQLYLLVIVILWEVSDVLVFGFVNGSICFIGECLAKSSSGLSCPRWWESVHTIKLTVCLYKAISDGCRDAECWGWQREVCGDCCVASDVVLCCECLCSKSGWKREAMSGGEIIDRDLRSLCTFIYVESYADHDVQFNVLFWSL